MYTRIESKKPNVYKVQIKTGHNSGSVFYVSSQIKVEKYLTEWANSQFEDSVYEIEMSRVGIKEDKQNFGTLVDTGFITLIESGVSFEVDVYKLNIL